MRPVPGLESAAPRQRRPTIPGVGLGTGAATSGKARVRVVQLVPNGLVNAIRRVVWESDTRAGRVFDTVVMSVIVGGLIVDGVATLESLDPRAFRVLVLANTAVTTLFIIEYALRLATAPKRWRYVRSFYGIVDLVAILPTLLGLDLRALRAFRLFRLLRLLKITRARALNRFGRALWTVKDEGLIFLFTTAVVLYLAAAGIYHFEHEAQPETFGSIPESLWWAVTTLTTVGYGDAYPVTTGGRMFTAVILLCGIAIVAAPAGLVATALSRAGKETKENERS